MEDDTLGRIRAILIKWWDAEEIPDEMNEARIVLIYKKGSTNTLGQLQTYFPPEQYVQDLRSNIAEQASRKT